VRLVFSLRKHLEDNPDYVSQVQKRTLDSRSLPGGLKGAYGLFGTTEWWQNIERGVAPVTKLTGIIAKTYREGMENLHTGFEMQSRDGQFLYRYTCVSNRKSETKLYAVGKGIELSYVTEPLKNPVPWVGKAPQTDAQTILEIWVEE
jgi:hypothetical protein